MLAKDLIENTDSPSAVMYWLHFFYNRLNFKAEEAMLHMSMGLHVKNILLSDTVVEGRTMIHVQYTDKKTSFHVYQDQLSIIVDGRNHVTPDNLERLDGTVDIPNRWMLALLQDHGSEKERQGQSE